VKSFKASKEMNMQPSPTLKQLESIDRMNEKSLDALPFGAIHLDREGKVLSYNQTEATLTGREKAKVIGKSFFTQVAPCTNVKAFAGRFREGIANKDMHVIFPYRFDFEMTPRDVTVTLFYSKQTDSAWVFVREAVR